MELLIKLAALSLCVSAVTALLKKSDEALSLLAACGGTCRLRDAAARALRPL
jgi:hypothetical protein